MEIPPTSKVVVVTDDPAIAAAASLAHAQERTYLPVFESPRMGRSDDANEVARCVEAIVRLEPSQVILSGLADTAAMAIRRKLPPQIRTHCPTASDLLGGPLPDDWQSDPGSIPMSLYRKLRARYERKGTQSKKRHLVVLERTDAVAGVIAVNLAFSIVGELIEIAAVGRDEKEDICREIMLVFERQEAHGSEDLKNIRSALRARVGIDPTRFSGITFVTSGLPYGTAFPEVPTTHLFSYPHLGLQIHNAILWSRNGSSGVRVAVTVDPSDQSNREMAVVAKVLSERGACVREIHGPEATVDRVGRCIEVFPFDFLGIATHCDEVPGRRTRYTFSDRDGRARELIVDQAVQFGRRPMGETVIVAKFNRLLALDGVNWNDRAGKDRINAEAAMEAFEELAKNQDPALVSEDLGPCGKVRDCMVLRMHDGNLVPFLNMLGGQNNPVVLNNACSSWHEFSNRFVYAGARAYIGTLFPVVDAEAQEFVGCLFGRHIHHPLARAVWKAQSEIYPDGRNPYVLVGAPFSLMRRGITHPEQFLLKRLENSIREGRHYISSQRDKRLQESAQRLNLYLEEEHRALAEILKSGRP